MDQGLLSSTMIFYPTAASSVIYNVPPLSAFQREAFDASVSYVATEKGIVPLGMQETDSVHLLSFQKIRRYLKENRIPRLTRLKDPVWSIASIGDPTGDRTIPITFNAISVLDEHFIRFIQSHILDRYPRWRILHTEDSDRPEMNLAIYPSAFSVGHYPASQNYSYISQWRQTVLAHRKSHDALLLRELADLSGRIKRVLTTSVVRSFCVLAAYDIGSTGNAMYHAWILVNGESPYDVHIEAGDYEEGEFYAVRKSGNIGQHLATRSPTELWLRQIVIPLGGSTTISVSHELDGEHITLELARIAAKIAV